MKIILHVFLSLSYITVTSALCSGQFNCGDCAAYKDCYWCTTSGKCEEYYGEKFANIICPNKWVQHDSLCPSNTDSNQGEAQLLNLLAKMKQKNSPSLESLLGAGSPSQLNAGSSGTSSQELKDLLHKLLLLKLLRKIKVQGTGSLTEQETSLLSKLSSFHQQPAITTTTTTKAPDMTNEIQKLLNLLHNHSTAGGEGQTKKPSVHPAKPVPTVANTKNTNVSSPTETTAAMKVKPTDGSNITTESVLSLLKKIDEQNAGVEYHENKPASLGKPDESAKMMKPTTAATSKSTTPKSTTPVNFCKLYEETSLCNSDHNCTWCNTRDVCIRRSGIDYKGCVDSKDRMKDKEFGKNISF